MRGSTPGALGVPVGRYGVSVLGGSANFADAFGEWGEIGIGQGHGFDAWGVLGDLEGAKEPLPAVVELAHLGGVAGEVVGHGIDGGEEGGRGQEGVVGLAEATARGATCGVGAVKPAGAGFGGQGDELITDLEGFGPVFLAGEDVPAQFEGDGVFLGGQG